jgi:four helix bundle protein
MSISKKSPLPHHRLEAYRVALQFLAAVKAAQVTDRKLKDEALRAAKSTCLNLAEGAGRVTRADKARAYAIARGETSEACAAVEIAVEAGDARRAALAPVLSLGGRLVMMITRLFPGFAHYSRAGPQFSSRPAERSAGAARQRWMDTSRV